MVQWRAGGGPCDALLIGRRRENMTFRTRSAAPAVLAIVALGGCGGDSGTGKPVSTGAAAPPAAPAGAPNPPPHPRDVPGTPPPPGAAPGTRAPPPEASPRPPALLLSR